MINHWISLKVKDQLDGDFLGKSFNRVNRDQVWTPGLWKVTSQATEVKVMRQTDRKWDWTCG